MIPDSSLSYLPDSRLKPASKPIAILVDLADRVLKNGLTLCEILHNLKACDWRTQADFFAFLHTCYQERFVRITSAPLDPIVALVARTTSSVVEITSLQDGSVKLSRFTFLTA